MLFCSCSTNLSDRIKLHSKVKVAAMIALAVVLAWPTWLRAQEPAPSTDRFDVTKNGIVDDSDAIRVTDAWFELQLTGQCMAPQWADYDFNGDGCLDIADIQLVLAHWGEQTAALKTPPDDIDVQAVAVFTVNSTGNEGDQNLNDHQCLTNSGACTLAAAIQQGNARPGREEIKFNIRGSNDSCPGQATIKPTNSNPLIIDDPRDEGIVIDGYTQCGASANTQSSGGNAVIKIQIEGGSAEGLTIYSANNTVRGLALYKWSRQIYVRGHSAKNNIIEGNFLGSNAANNCVGNGGEGIALEWGANNNIVGGTTPAARNVVTCQGEDAVDLYGDDVKNNRIIGNYIGVKQDGKSGGGNGADGVDIAEGASDNWIGGYQTTERNVISKNGRDGIEISHQVPTKNNYVVNNYIGLSSSGETAGNGSNGITLEDLVNANHIYYNIIVDNGANGIRGYGLCNDNKISGNYIGVGPDGITPMPNGQDPTLELGVHGMYIFGGCQRNLIWSNIIAHNPGQGIWLTREKSYLGYSSETHYNSFIQNSIHHNGITGIRLAKDGNKYPNKGIKSPQLNFANPTTILGTACPNCKIEIFVADKTSLNDPSGDNAGEGQWFIGQGFADATGNFTLAIGGVSQGQLLTATATDGEGNTSEFAKNVAVEAGPPPAPTPVPTPEPGPGPGPNPDLVLWLPVVHK